MCFFLSWSGNASFYWFHLEHYDPALDPLNFSNLDLFFSPAISFSISSTPNVRIPQPSQASQKHDLIAFSFPCPYYLLLVTAFQVIPMIYVFSFFFDAFANLNAIQCIIISLYDASLFSSSPFKFNIFISACYFHITFYSYCIEVIMSSCFLM